MECRYGCGSRYLSAMELHDHESGCYKNPDRKKTPSDLKQETKDLKQRIKELEDHLIVRVEMMNIVFDTTMPVIKELSFLSHTLNPAEPFPLEQKFTAMMEKLGDLYIGKPPLGEITRSELQQRVAEIISQSDKE